MMFNYLRHSPSSPLNTFIDYLYYSEGRLYSQEKMLPMSKLHLVLNFGDAIQAFDGIHNDPLATCTASWAIGTWSVYHIARWPPNNRFYGVCFKPGRAFPFLRLPLIELHNQFVTLEAIWGPYAAEVRERLHAVPSIQAGFEVLERLLLARLGEMPHGFDVVRYAVAQIARRHGAISIQSLSDHIGISQNHLGTYFKRMVGLSPKGLARLYRLTHALRTIDITQPVDWTWIAHQSGYYDQSHFNHDFAAFLGLNPTDYLRLRGQMHAMDPERDRLLRTLPMD